jgi:hypothetical protein
MPLEVLWRPDGRLIGPRGRLLPKSEIAELLRDGPVEFALADVGEELQWINPRDCYVFWKSEVRSHLAEIGSPICLDRFPGGYCYTPSE